MRLTSPWHIWAIALLNGLRCMRREPGIGLRRLVLPVSYWRLREFTYACQRLTLAPGSRVLDLGSPKELAAYLAEHRGYEVVASDILPLAVELSDRYTKALGLQGHGSGLVHNEVQDGRALTYPDDSFDGAFAVSVVEHIPDQGDTAAIRELLRVVRPGGLVVITTPFGPTYRETFVDRPVYERPQHGNLPVFYERRYDNQSLQERLLSNGGATVVDKQIWGEGGVRMERFLTRSKWMRTLLSPLEPAMALACLRRLNSEAQGRPMAVFVTLEKRPTDSQLG